MIFVVCKLPKAGLGNQLFPLMKALVFARLNGVSASVIGYHQVKLGPYIRGERSKRNYLGYFTFEKTLFAETWDRIRINFLSRTGYRVIEEPDLTVIDRSHNAIYVFSRMPHWTDYFAQLKDFRPLVIELFWDAIRPSIIQQLGSVVPHKIGVHVRLGDFRKLKAGEDFAKVGAVRTPLNYFTEVVGKIRQVHGTSLEVGIFTDGKREELADILKLENVDVVNGKNDILDMLLLSKSKVIITSAGSTFSYWAGFISDALLIMHPEHLHASLRPVGLDFDVYEGPFEETNALLVKSIRKL